MPAPPPEGPSVEQVRGALHSLREETAERPAPEPEPETSEELDVEGPGEGAPGHNPDPDETGDA